jgi:hypothetical protein
MPRPVPDTLARWLDQAVNSPDAARACRSVTALLVPLLLAAAGLLGPGTAVPLDVTFVALSAQALAGVDIRGPYPLRLGFLLTMVAIMVGSTALGTLVGPYPAAAALGAGLIAVHAGAWRHLTPEYGPMLAAPVGLVFLIAANAPPEHGSHALAVLAGSGWAVLVQVALWPVRAQHGLRQVVGDAWQAASELFEAMAAAGFTADDVAHDYGLGHGHDEADDGGANDRDGDGDAESHLDDGKPSAVATAAGALRTSLEAAYATLEGVGTGRPLVALLDAAMHAAGRLGLRAAGLGTALESLADRPDAAALDTRFRAVMEALAAVARAIGLAVVSRQPAHLAACEVRLRRSSTLLAALKSAVLADSPQGPCPAARQVAVVIDLIDDQLADSVLTLVALTDRAGERAVFPLELFDINTWRLRPLAAALNLSPKPDPALVRFTVRLAVLMSLGVLVVKLSSAVIPGHPLTHSYWLPFTILVVSQTDYGATRKKAAERLGGTLVGSVVGSGLLMLHLPRPALFAAAGAAGFLFAFFLRREYRVAVVFITVLVVVLTEMNHPVTVELTAERLGLTVVGGAVALAAALVFWPAWERTRFPAMLAAALRANRDYANAVVSRLAAGGMYTPADVKARRSAEKATAAALASLARLYADPANQRRGVERAAVLANGNQRVGRFLNLLMVRATPAAAPVADPALPAFARRATASLTTLAEAVEQAKSPAALRAEAAAEASGAAGVPVDPSGKAGGAGEFGELLARTQTELDAMLQYVNDDRHAEV